MTIEPNTTGEASTHTTSPPIDPELTDILELVRGAIPATGLTTAEFPVLRAAFGAVPSDQELDPEGLWTISEAHARAGDARTVRLVVCRPQVDDGTDQPTPVLYYAHGGGLVAGHARSNLGEILAMAAVVGAAVVSVDYRLAPESQYPAALEDCLAGLEWLRETGPSLGLSNTCVILAGSSAGGGLAAAMSLVLRDRGSRPATAQMLMAPMLDDRGVTGSSHQLEGVGVWDRVSNATAWAAYLGPIPVESVPAWAAPSRATDLSQLPPTFLDCGDSETFRDEVVDFASRIWLAGGSAELHVWPGGFHQFDSIAPHTALAAAARSTRTAWLARIIDRSALDDR